MTRDYKKMVKQLAQFSQQENEEADSPSADGDLKLCSSITHKDICMVLTGL
jgi:hypothetical protein